MTDRRDPSPHNEIVRFWCDHYQEHAGEKYPFNGGKDGKTIKDLRAIYSDDAIKSYMSAFFEMSDPFFEEAGHSLGVFRACLPKVIAYVRRGSQDQQMGKAAATVFRVLGGGR